MSTFRQNISEEEAKTIIEKKMEVYIDTPYRIYSNFIKDDDHVKICYAKEHEKEPDSFELVEYVGICMNTTLALLYVEREITDESRVYQLDKQSSVSYLE